MANYRVGCSVRSETGEGPLLPKLAAACEAAMDAGFAYVEIGADTLMALTEEELTEATSLPIEAVSGFPACEETLVGGDFTTDTPLYTYVTEVLRRMKRLGIPCLVFDGAAPRYIPASAAFADAMLDIGNFLWMCGNLAMDYDVAVVILPLCPEKCNAINYTCEAAALAAMVNRPRVGYAADSGEMQQGGESATALADVVLPWYIRVAADSEQTYLAAFADTLKDTAYAGRVTVRGEIALPREYFKNAVDILC